MRFQHIRPRKRPDSENWIVAVSDVELLDRLYSNGLQEELVHFIEAEKPTKVSIDFSLLQRANTEMINAMLTARHRIEDLEGDINLCRMRPEIREIFSLLNLDGSVFQIFDTLEEAIHAIA